MDTTRFLTLIKEGLMIDVRSPKEFEQGHIPNAINIPLLSDEERHEVGMIYTHASAEKAFIRGLELVGPKLAYFYSRIKELSANNGTTGLPLGIYCWRGGMRSNHMANLLRMWGYEVYVLKGGYKAYRKAFCDLLDTYSWQFRLLGGFTGCGKTEVLAWLAEKGEQVIDLEAIAGHKGSVFGHLGMRGQPTSEMVENHLHHLLRSFNPAKPVWIEAESCRIGNVQLPDSFFNRMKQAPLYLYEIPFENRIERLCREYGGFDKEDLATAFRKIERRLGLERTRQALSALDSGDLKSAAAIALVYYDRSYEYSLKEQQNSHVYALRMDMDDPEKGAQNLIEFVN